MSTSVRETELKATRSRGRKPQSAQLREAREALYREHILEVAEAIFADQGFANTRMQDIAKAAGISLAKLYQVYPGKDELYRGILIERDAEMLEAVMSKGQALLAQPQSVEQLLWLTGINLRYLLEHPDYLRMQLQEGYAWYHSAAQASTDEKMMWERGLAMMEQVFAWGAQAGFFLPDNPTDMARMLMSLQQTRLANWVSANMQEAHDRVIQRIQADFVRNFCVPKVAAQLLAKDGASLSKATQEKIQAFDQGAV